ncbi:MAG TPA: hypothetical protein VG167_18935 [Verrucomicrobiae bacterium]|nr:hypothetical protein [Verrucomicrobiae bacterium]
MSVQLIDAVELAFVSLIQAAVGTQANGYPGKSSGTKALPCFIAAADGSSLEEDPPRSGNYWVDVEVSVKAIAATEPGAGDPVLADYALAQTVFNTLQVSNLDVLLNSQGQLLTVMPNGFFFGTPRQLQDEEGAWVDILAIKLYCCNSILAA